MMHRRISSFIYGCFLVCVTGGAQATSSGHDWPRFLGPTGDGISGEAIRSDWTEKGPDVLWFERVGEGYGAPSVAAGRLFLFDRTGDTARLRALDAADGTELWTSGYPTDYEDLYAGSDGPRSTPVVDGDRVFVFGVEGRLRAQAVDSGKVLWEVDTHDRYGVVPFYFGAGASPLVERNLVIVPVGGSPAGSPPLSLELVGNGSGIVAFDKATGQERYRLSNQLASYSSPVTATISGRRWGFLFARGGLIGFDPVRGVEHFFFPWRAKQLASANAANPLVVDDTVFLTETYGPGSVLLRVSPEGVKPIWKDPRRGKSMQGHWATPIFHDGILYGSSGRTTGEAELRAIEHRTGKVRWCQPDLGRSTLLYADGHLIVLTENGRLLLVKASPERFALAAEMDLGEPSEETTAVEPNHDTANRPILRFPAWNAPVLSHGRLYLRGKDQLICLDVATDSEAAED